MSFQSSFRRVGEFLIRLYSWCVNKMQCMGWLEMSNVHFSYCIASAVPNGKLARKFRSTRSGREDIQGLNLPEFDPCFACNVLKHGWTRGRSVLRSPVRGANFTDVGSVCRSGFASRFQSNSQEQCRSVAYWCNSPWREMAHLVGLLHAICWVSGRQMVVVNCVQSSSSLLL